MRLPTTGQIVSVLLTASAASTHASAIPEKRTKSNVYQQNAHAAITELQTYYNTPYQGFWTVGWWNSANCLTMLADLRAKDNSNFLTSLTDGDNGIFLNTLNNQDYNSNGALAYDDFFDDELWWVVALIRTYDVTNNQKFLNAATASFARVRSDDATSPCGGIANAYPGEQYRVESSTIATALYVEAAALLAARVPAQKDMYVTAALRRWSWLNNNMFIDGIIQGDSLVDYPTCTNYHAYLTYIEGVAISGLVALTKATGNQTFIQKAEQIAANTINGAGGLVVNGIVTEFCDADFSCNQDESQFKGIFMRGLKMLWLANPGALNGSIPNFLKQNAISIWNNNRGPNNLLGLKWSGPFEKYTGTGTSYDGQVQLAAHSSATMALIYAALTNWS